MFILTLPLMQSLGARRRRGILRFRPVDDDRAPLDFTQDWLAANTSFRMGRVDAEGNIASDQYTPTGHLDNHFSVGPAILWSPFLIAAHAGVLAYDRLGGHVSPDGYSKPYLVAMALGTAV